jgi:uncharacterized membrane protein (UPF0127 family)
LRALVKKEDEIIGDRIKVAHNFGQRLQGLLGKKTLKKGEGLLLIPCRQVHTFLMSFYLDVLFLNKQGEIVALVAEMAPGCKSPLVQESYQVLELPVGTIALKNLKKGDCLEIIKVKEKV